VELDTARAAINVLALSLVVGPAMLVPITSSMMEENRRNIWEVV
jgi:hypothetical protein